jgi:uroporphyrin-III C-methyltransferase
MTGLPASFPPFATIAPGEVWLVGAGPGDPRLLTLMAANAIAQADDIVFDALVDRRLLELAQPGVAVHFAGKRGGLPSPHQADINELIVGLARAGKRVVRLKGGDPFVFGRGGEEALVLAAARVPFRIVPGLSSGLTGPALAGIPATTRDTNHAVVLATGHRAVDEASALDWQRLAATGQTLILYMAMANLPQIVAAFETGGMPLKTPVAVITDATTADEKVLTTTLAAVVADVAEAGLKPPAILVFGVVAGIRAELLPWLKHD